jgi:hypothetical protein
VRLAPAGKITGRVASFRVCPLGGRSRPVEGTQPSLTGPLPRTGSHGLPPRRVGALVRPRKVCPATARPFGKGVAKESAMC